MQELLRQFAHSAAALIEALAVLLIT